MHWTSKCTNWRGRTRRTERTHGTQRKCWTDRLNRVHWTDRAERSSRIDRNDWIHWVHRIRRNERIDWPAGTTRSCGRKGRRQHNIYRTHGTHWTSWSSRRRCRNRGSIWTHWIDRNPRVRRGWADWVFRIHGTHGTHRKYWTIRVNWTNRVNWTHRTDRIFRISGALWRHWSKRLNRTNGCDRHDRVCATNRSTCDCRAVHWKQHSLRINRPRDMDSSGRIHCPRNPNCLEWIYVGWGRSLHVLILQRYSMAIKLAISRNMYWLGRRAMGCWNTDKQYLDLTKWHRVDVNPDGRAKTFWGRVERVVVGRCWRGHLFVTERNHVDSCVP